MVFYEWKGRTPKEGQPGSRVLGQRTCSDAVTLPKGEEVVHSSSDDPYSTGADQVESTVLAYYRIPVFARVLVQKSQ